MSWPRCKKITSGIQCGRASGCVREEMVFSITLETWLEFQQTCEEESKEVDGSADLLSVWQRIYELHPNIYRHALQTLGASWNIRNCILPFKIKPTTILVESRKRNTKHIHVYFFLRLNHKRNIFYSLSIYSELGPSEN